MFSHCSMRVHRDTEVGDLVGRRRARKREKIKTEDGCGPVYTNASLRFLVADVGDR